MNAQAKRILTAMQATTIPEGEHGLWAVRKIRQPPAITLEHSGQATGLYCLTNDTQYHCHGPAGALVMIDHLLELRTHLEFIFRASGHVLVTGLGLGCIVRGLLATGRCTQITVIEREASVIKLVWPFMPTDSLSLVHADALAWCRTNCQTFDFAWHDVWNNPDKHEPDLSIIHAELMVALRHTVGMQGAWKFPRCMKRRWPAYVG